jgi:chromate transporter
VQDGVSTLLTVASVFASLSLVSIGGGNTVLPEIHRAAVQREQWMTDQQFADIYAISEAAPGPSSMISSLVGYKAAGLAGAIVAIASILGPSSLLMYVACLTWERFRTAKWRIAFEKGLAPVSLGLLFSSGLTVVRSSDHSLVAYAISAVSVVLLLRTKVSPLLVMAAAGVLGAFGLVG